jgi:hypothetical protein
MADAREAPRLLQRGFIYKDVGTMLRSVRRDAAKANRAALKDLDKLQVALTPGSRTRRSSRRTASGSSSDRRRRTSSTQSDSKPS